MNEKRRSYPFTRSEDFFLGALVYGKRYLEPWKLGQKVGDKMRSRDIPLTLHDFDQNHLKIEFGWSHRNVWSFKCIFTNKKYIYFGCPTPHCILKFSRYLNVRLYLFMSLKLRIMSFKKRTFIPSEILLNRSFDPFIFQICAHFSAIPS